MKPAAPKAMRRLALALVVAGGLGACGEDDPPPQQQRINATPTGAAVPGATGGPAGSKTLLAEKLHVEDRVVCPIPDKPSDPQTGKCDPRAPSCAEHLYCLQLPQGFFCEPCPERDGIRHVFKERDFVDSDQNRDPFRVARATDIGPPIAGGETQRCTRKDQMVASNFSYADLKLVGIVAQATQRKVLMINGREGYIIKRGDCVGKEKAVVKDIGTGYVTFQIEPDPDSVSRRPPQEYSVALNPRQLTVEDQGDFPPTARPTTITPVIPPPPVLPPRAAPPGAGSAAAAPAPAPAPAQGAAAAPAPAGGSAAPVTAPPAAGSAPPPVAPPPVAPPPATKK